MMRRDALVVRVKRDQFGPERATVGGHDAEETLVLGHRQDQPHRLLDLAGGKIAQRTRHRRDQLFHPQKERTFSSSRNIIVAAVYDRRKRSCNKTFGAHRAPLQVDQLAEFLQIDIPTGNDADNRTIPGFTGQGGGERHGARAFGNDPRLFRHQAHCLSRLFQTND